MNPTTLRFRFWLFLIGCIGSRSLFTMISYYASCMILRWIGILALGPVVGWFYLIFLGRRDTGLEVMGDRIWWQSLRPVHMTLWGFFSYLAIRCHHSAWIVLAVDTLFGLGSFLWHHYTEGNLRYMLGL